MAKQIKGQGIVGLRPIPQQTLRKIPIVGSDIRMNGQDSPFIYPALFSF